jgi:hypothetical protein
MEVDSTMVVKRDLDGVYFRVMRDGKGANLCWTDLMWEERIEFARKNNNEGWLIRMIQIMNDVARNVVAICPGASISMITLREGKANKKSWLRNALFRLTADIRMVAEEYNVVAERG